MFKLDLPLDPCQMLRNPYMLKEWHFKKGSLSAHRNGHLFKHLLPTRSKPCMPREVPRSRCPSSVPWSNSFCSLHGKTSPSPQCHGAHRQLLLHGPWYILRCKWLDSPWKNQCNKFHRSRLRRALPSEESHPGVCSASQPIHKVVLRLGVHLFHQPKEKICANGGRLRGRSKVHNTRVWNQSCFQVVTPHIPCTESVA